MVCGIIIIGISHFGLIKNPQMIFILDKIPFGGVKDTTTDIQGYVCPRIGERS